MQMITERQFLTAKMDRDATTVALLLEVAQSLCQESIGNRKSNDVAIKHEITYIHCTTQ